ncbi:hypothetical protein BO85DRAFT_443621, partial [Aspergillus piperis CBS 112811]
HPHATGLGWVDGMGQGSDTQLYTVDLTPTRDQASVGRMGRAWDNNTHTQHSSSSYPAQGATTYPAQGATTLLAHGRVEGTGLRQQSTTRQHNTDSYGSGLMVGWMGRAWKTLLYILTSIYDIARQLLWPHGWVDGMGLEDHIIYTCSVLTQGFTASATSQALVGWQGRAWAIRRILAVDIGHKAVSCQLPHLGMMDFTSTTNQALVGWQGWAWVVARRHRLSTRSLSEPRRGWLVGTGWVTSVTRHWVDTGDPALNGSHSEPGLGWVAGTGLGHRTRGWRVWVKFYRSNKPSLGWVAGSGLGYRIQHPSNSSLQWWTRPRLGGWDGPGTSDTGEGGLGHMSDLQIKINCLYFCMAPSLGWVAGMGLGYRIQHPPHRFTAVVSQASVGWLGRAWDIGHGGGGRRHPWMGGRDGLGLSDSTSIIQVHCSGEPQALVGWKGRAWDLLTLTAKVHCSGEPGPECYPTNTSCPGWVDGTGLGYRLTTTAQVHHCSGPGLGWAVGTGLGHRIQHLIHTDIYRFTTAVSQALVGWLGRAWVIGHGVGGFGLSDRLHLLHYSLEDQALDGRLGRAWVSDSISTIQFTTAVSHASVGRLGRAWDIGHRGGGVPVRLLWWSMITHRLYQFRGAV